MIEHAIAMARRSPFWRFKTGAVIVNSDRLVSVGWSHPCAARWREYYSMHAEIHAIIRADPRMLVGSEIYIATLTRHDNTTNAKPCEPCENWLRHVGLERIWYTAPFGTGDPLFIDLY